MGELHVLVIAFQIKLYNYADMENMLHNFTVHQALSEDQESVQMSGSDTSSSIALSCSIAYSVSLLEICLHRLKILRNSNLLFKTSATLNSAKRKLRPFSSALFRLPGAREENSTALNKKR